MKGSFENTFENGLSSDFNVVYQPQGTYRFMKNCSLISQDGNNFVVKDSIGNVLTFTINTPYNGVYTLTDALPKILAMISFPNQLIVFSTNSLTGGYMEIGTINYLPYGEGVQADAQAGQYNAGYVPLYHNLNLNGSQQHKIKGFSFIENDLIRRVYWTDNFNEPRVFNVSDPIFSTYFASGSLIPGQQYMVLEGAITHNTFNYGPGLTLTVPSTSGNVFTAANANYTNLTGTSPTPKVIKYYPYQLLDFTPSRSLGNITFDEFGAGNLYCGSKVYFYRLGNNAGVVTTWSYGSSPVPVGTTNNSNSLSSPTVQYQDYVGGGTSDILLKSSNCVFLNIENIDTNFDYIELACAEFDQLINQPRLISIVSRMNITSPTMNIKHDGNINLGNLTIGDVTLFPASILKVKTLATNKNYILAGNITERTEFDIDLRIVSDSPPGIINATRVNYPMNSHYDASSCSLSGMVPSGVSPVTGVNPSAGSVTPFSRWLVTAGTATYNSVTYTPGQVITGVTGAGNDTITFAGGGQVRPCVTKNRYTTFGGVRRENAIELKGSNPANTCFWDYKSAAVHHHMAGYWSNEIYRFGILFYDLKGNPFYVKFLLDYQFPEVTNAVKGGLIRNDVIGNTPNTVYSLNPTILSISGITIPPSLINKISGFSIVRAKRDARIVAQGLVLPTIDTGLAPKVYRPTAWTTNVAEAYNYADRVYSYICPDQLVGVPLSKPIGVLGDTMEEAIWLSPYNYGGVSYVRGQGLAASEQVYTKYLSCVNDIPSGGTLRTGTISYYGSVDENQTLTGMGNGETFQNSSMLTNAAANVSGGCVAGTTDYSLNAYIAIGSKKSVFRLSVDFLNYGPAILGYTNPFIVSSPQKILMNYVKTGFSNPYGGTSASAKANTLYISTGHFQPITTAVKADVFDGTNYVFNNIEIAGGDCYTCLVDQGYGLWNNTSGVKRYSYALTFPCECNSNYNLRRGRKSSNVEMYYSGTSMANSIAAVDGTGAVRLEGYEYNQGYSTEGQQVVYPATPINLINSGQFQARIRFAGVKFSGETIDSFRKFLITDFKDLSYNYGRINDINVKEDKVIVWQDNAINTVPILQRQQTVSSTGDTVNIGTGGVVDRFDVINSYFGTQHQWSITETQYGFAWFDMSRKAFVILDFRGGLQEISQIFGLKGFFDEVFVEIEGNTLASAAVLLNSPTFADTSDRPIAGTGIGIISVYDPKFKMTYMTFKFFGQILTGFKSKDFTIGYLHTDTKKCFVGFFDWFPYHVFNHNGIVLSANNPKNVDQYLLVLTNKSFALGETVWNTAFTIEYICIAPVTLDNAAKFPDGVSSATYWTPINAVNQLWVHNQPALLNQAVAPDYQYNKYFGRVINNEIHVIINPPMEPDNDFEVLAVNQIGSVVNYTDVYIDADVQTAQDINISLFSRFYRAIRDKISFTPPLAKNGRISNKYLRIKFIKKNWTTNPSVLTGVVKILRSVSSVFNTKR